MHFPQTNNNRILNYYKGVVFCGCFKGSLELFIKAVEQKPEFDARRVAYSKIIEKIKSS